jgi:hypothetical protein
MLTRRIYNHRFRSAFFSVYTFVNILLCFIMFFSLPSVDGDLAPILSGLFFILVSTLLSRHSIFQKRAFAFFFCIFTLLYISIPIVFILLNNTYEFGIGLNYIPYKQKEYHDILPIATVYLTILWFLIWAAILSVKVKSKKLNVNKHKDIKISAIVGVGLIVLISTYFDNIEIAQVYLDKYFIKEHTLLVFILFDHAYLILAGFLLIYKINVNFSKRELSRVSYVLFLLFLSFLWVASINGASKAAILSITTLLFFYPISLFNQYTRIALIIPSNKVLIACLVLSPIMFYIVLLQRLGIQTSGGSSNITLLLSQMDANSFFVTLEVIMYRLSAGAIDPYILIFKSFSMSSDFSYGAYFLEYISKSFVNLAWPGSPYPEAISTSSMFLPDVLYHNSFESNISNSSQLIRSLNTQPYTIFGFSLILFGLIIAPLFIYIFYYLLSILYKQLNYDLLRLAILYFCVGSFGVFGFEVVLANSAHILISMIIMYYLMVFLSNYKKIINRIIKF